MPDHPGLHVELELARGAAVAGEERDAVAVRVVVDEPDRVVVRVGAHDREHRPEDLVAVGVHLGRHVVEQRDAEEEPVTLGRRLAPVGDDRGALVGAGGDVGGDLVAMLAGDERPHLGLGLEAVPDLHVRAGAP